jgi:NO-binding membrane sensor protein with MHYT domain
MQSLIPFLKHSSTLDLLVILLGILITVLLVPIGIWIVSASRSRRPIYFFLIIAVLPLVLGHLETYLRFRGMEKALELFPDASHEVLASASHEAWIATYIGAAGTVVLWLIGLTGLVLKKKERPEPR